MFKLDNDFLQSLGLGGLPVDEKNRLLQMIYERLEMNVGMRLAEKMTDQQLDEFEGFIDRNDEAGALKWLETNFPNYKDVVAEELEKLKSEVQSAAPQIIASQNSGGAQPMPSIAQELQMPGVPQPPQYDPSQPMAAQQPMNQPMYPQANMTQPMSQPQYAPQQPAYSPQLPMQPSFGQQPQFTQPQYAPSPQPMSQPSYPQPDTMQQPFAQPPTAPQFDQPPPQSGVFGQPVSPQQPPFNGPMPAPEPPYAPQQPPAQPQQFTPPPAGWQGQ